MNAVEIEEAISSLAAEAFDSASFPYDFLEAFGNKATTIKRLRTGNNNKSDVAGGVLQFNNIHIAVSDQGAVSQTLDVLRGSPATSKQKAKFILATDGEEFQAEDLTSGETVVCDYQNFPNYFGFFLPLAGISTVKQIRESSFDIRATSRLNKLYVELLQHNPEWSRADRRHDMNHFMARLIFCFFAEDTDIFEREGLFTDTVARMTTGDASDTHEVIGELFRTMNTKREDHESARVKRWAKDFPYVNGGLFSGDSQVPHFTRIARSYLLNVGGLDWKQINPDIFGSMIQAVADDDERGELGMHYTSVPNILKVLNPLFLDDLRGQLEEAGDNARKLLNLRKRLARIRVFDPACGSGNFLVIAYKQMREIEAEISKRREEADRVSEIPLTNFRGIELRDFSAEIARLALIIAEYQCNVLHRGKQLALAEFLPLNAENWITCGNALRIDWLSICPPTGTGVKIQSDDLFGTPLEQPQIDFKNEGGETYICGNPPYLGASLQSNEQKSDLESIFNNYTSKWKILDYVAGWFMKAAEYGKHTLTVAAFVATNSLCQGQQVPTLWPLVFDEGYRIAFAYTSFKWKNLASHNAGVMVVIVGISNKSSNVPSLFTASEVSGAVRRDVENINAYLVPSRDVYIRSEPKPINGLTPMDYGSKPADGRGLVLGPENKRRFEKSADVQEFILPYIGSDEFIDGKQRYCLWIDKEQLESALTFPAIRERIEIVRSFRSKSTKKQTRDAVTMSHAFLEIRYGHNARTTTPYIIPIHTSENREFLPVGFLPIGSVISNAAFALYDAPLWSMALIASRLHLVWIATVCGKLETRYRYSNTIGWNTFPVPKLTEKNKTDLTRCAEDILLAREAHFPATIADLYDPQTMPEDLRQAHEHNDEVLERIYIGRRFKNDSERLEKLFELYTEMTSSSKPTKSSARERVSA